VLHNTPDDHGMAGWRDIYLPSDDGTPLEGWYIPAKGGESDKLVIFNHALPMCRAGFPGHLGEPWSAFDTVEIDFVLLMKHLTDAGYNVLAYDIRNHGNSGAANGGLSGIGRWEWRDCVGEWKWGNPVWSHHGIVCTGEAYTRVVKLTFARGSGIPGPARLFNSSLEGNTRRAIDIHEQGDDLAGCELTHSADR
jgi:hypothetical protein